MKITLEFEHPCELVDLLEKITKSYILPTGINSVSNNKVEDSNIYIKEPHCVKGVKKDNA